MIYTGELSLKTKGDGENYRHHGKGAETRDRFGNTRRYRDGICPTFHLRDNHGGVRAGFN